ncbi:MAG: patatin-like phospholipase family protein [Zhaonellaceae bacterium]|nr:patatin family protein [Clostridia bacterium]
MGGKLKVGLALGSGAAKGLAHIGILKVLVRENIPIDLITGSSIGSLIGALFAAGADLGMLEKISCSLQQKQLVDVTVPRFGLIKGDKVEALVKLLTKNMTFQDLKIPLYVVAVDLEEGKQVVFEKGPVSEAVRASISIPGIFQPKKIGGKILVDGAVLNRVPAKIAREKGAQVVIGVDLKEDPKMRKAKPIENIFDVILTSIDLLEGNSSINYNALCDVMIRPKVSDIGIADFHKAEECIALGEEAAEMALPEIKKVLEQGKCI